MCKITDELFKDPVVLSSGFTYEREFIVSHFKHNGQNDPLTREEVNYKLFPNKAMKAAVEGYLAQNPWAYDYYPGQKSDKM